MDRKPEWLSAAAEAELVARRAELSAMQPNAARIEVERVCGLRGNKSDRRDAWAVLRFILGGAR